MDPLLKIDFIGKSIPQARSAANKMLVARKAWLISQFWTHPVTREIVAGSNAENLSGSLADVEGPANLWGFIGFERGSEPVEPIMQMLEQIQLGAHHRLGKMIVFDVIMPTAEEIFDATPMPWAAGRSWAEGIEQGISGVGYFLADETDRSRSGAGVQVTNKLRGGVYKRQKYISFLLKEFKRKLNDSAI